MSFIRSMDVSTVIILDRMTGYTLLQAVLLGAYAAIHGFITVVLDVIHVVVSHVISSPDT